MSRRSVMMHRNRQQFREFIGTIFDLLKTIFINGLMVMLAPILTPIMLAIQLWNTLPSFRQVRRAMPRSFGDLQQSIPSGRQVWNSVPSVGQVLNMVVRMLQNVMTEYMARVNPSEIGRSTRPPAL